MSTTINTLVLRYRDLSAKDTIMLHSELISKKGYVWWGWWAKPQEKVAQDVFSSLMQTAKSEEHLRIFLLDSGKVELRSALCTDIDFDPSGDPKESPSKPTTPKYYQKTKYMLWFKLEEISEPIAEPQTVISEYSYVIVDEHFASSKSPFAAFDGKKVYDLEELVEQQCTIWYLRKALDGDKTGRIVSYSPGAGEADNSFAIDRSNRLLWLSDLHFSKDHHAFKKTVGSDNSLYASLKERLDKIKPNSFSRILVSGDFTFRSSSDEFELARGFFDQMSSNYSIPGSSYIFCPGNHDMMYANEEYKDDDPVVLNFADAKKNYIEFYEKVRGTKSNKYNNSVQRFITSNGVLVEIIALNTCILQQDSKHFRGMGFAGKDQLRDLADILKKTERMKSIRILTMHHHLLPVVYAEEPKVNPMYSLLLDSGAISKFCMDNNISIVLHGHTHENYYAELTREIKNDEKKTIRNTIHVIGLGSTGAIRDDLPGGKNNQFALLAFEKESLKIKIFEIFPDGSNENDESKCEYSINYGEING